MAWHAIRGPAASAHPLAELALVARILLLLLLNALLQPANVRILPCPRLLLLLLRLGGSAT
jgi:hypothetical protein